MSPGWPSFASTKGMTANLIQSVVRPLEQLAVTGTFAVGVYLAAHHQRSGLCRRAVRVPAAERSGSCAAHADGAAGQPVRRGAPAPSEWSAELVNQPPEEGRGDHGVRTPLKGHVEFSEVTFNYKGATSPALERVSFEVPRAGCSGIMGRSGSGKTTVTRLLQALHSRLSGPDQDRRHRPARDRPRSSAPQPRRRAAGEFPVPRHDPREHRRRQAPRDLRGGRRGGAARRRRGVHRAAAARLRDLHPGRLDQPVRRPAPAARDRPRPDHRSAHPDPRRGDQRARRRQRGDRQRQPDAHRRRAAR